MHDFKAIVKTSKRIDFLSDTFGLMGNRLINQAWLCMAKKQQKSNTSGIITTIS